ncbi:MAG: methylenetetrahydrofolate--tRNA-(uracil(54)-C(5))-methyltransferase (FADH(2)-oxidizing) TrmFO [Candidatus Eisenbacteria bacterium]
MSDSTGRPVTVVGGGLAGSEAAWQLARRGLEVRLFEMRPAKSTEAHRTGNLAELVCSNSFKSERAPSAPALLKRELEGLGSLLVGAARETGVPAGSALAVDREKFASLVTGKIESEPLIEVVREEFLSIPEDGHVIVATGPLTSDALATDLVRIVGNERLFFYDAIAPVVGGESIDLTRVFAASRYGKGGEDYLNVPLTEESYGRFVEGILAADLYPIHEFEKDLFFEACLPIEEIARRGRNSLRFGPLKPVGLVDPSTGERPYAAIQLRMENREGTAWNLVGCQTRMRRGEQKRIFRMLPGMEDAEFLRYGSLHRNTFLCAPKVLDSRLSLRAKPRVRLAGQITGVEGYVESIAMGLVAAIETARDLRGDSPVDWARETAIGSLLHFLQDADPDDFQPTNIHFGLFPALDKRVRKKRERQEAVWERAVRSFNRMVARQPDLGASES